jgi:hypothetical protein
MEGRVQFWFYQDVLYKHGFYVFFKNNFEVFQQICSFYHFRGMRGAKVVALTISEV